MIEKLTEEEQVSKWELVKLNTEEDYEVVEQFNIRSIPNVKMFYKGEVVVNLLTAPYRAPPSSAGWSSTCPITARRACPLILSRLNGEGGMSELEAFIAQNPRRGGGTRGLARKLVYSNPERAAALVETIQLGDALESAEDLRTLAELMSAETDDTPAGRLVAAAQEALRKKITKQPSKASSKRPPPTKAFAKDLPRRAGIALFRLWGTRRRS
ncbi:MAG: hypothetical protein H6559_19055 [Lewinellaceae bacterium]|nr:hypothetical protein [Lewinellaceae bacterium]